MSEDWQAGDLALCVNDAAHPWSGCPGVKRGCVYTVQAILSRDYPSPIFGRGDGLALVGVLVKSPLGLAAIRFRKIRPHEADAEDRETIALLTGVPVLEPVQ